MAFRGAHDDKMEPHLRLHPPKWVTTGITAALLVSGFTRRQALRASPRDRSLGAGLREFRRRGRFASAPSEIPALGWKDILLRVYRSIPDDRIIALAAGVTFYAILAIFPALAALVSVYGLFADPGVIQHDLDALSSVLPPGVTEVIGDQMRRLVSHGQTTLGATFAVSLIFSLWSANSGVQALFDALNIVYHEREKRSYPRLYAISLAFTAGGVAFGVLAVVIVAVLPVALSYLQLASVTDVLLRVARWPVLLVLVALVIAMFYRYGPSRQKARWRWISWGSVLASLLWLGASILFSWYTTSLGSYDRTYGSLGTVIIFMTWIWISNIVILLGAELDAEVEHQTMRDSTTGRPRPLGQRGAHMADTVGAPQSWSGSDYPAPASSQDSASAPGV